MIEKIYARYGKKRTLITGSLLLVALGAGGYFIITGNKSNTEAEVVQLPVVTVRTVNDLATTNTFSAVGTVAAVSEARLQTEAGGRVTAVSTTIGNHVGAGQVIATIESSQQSAALLQAQGAYEAALAGAQQSDSGTRDANTGLTSAQEAAIVAVQNSYTAVNGTLINSIDQFFSMPEGTVPGLKIGGNTTVLSSERVAYQTLLPKWQQNISAVSKNNIDARLDEAEANVTRTIAFVDMFVAETNAARDSEQLDGKPVRSYTAGLLTQSTALSGTLQSIQGARSKLSAAEEAVVRASTSGTAGGQLSLANAQVKIALGSLRSAQSAYEKTLVRSPISGVVNALYLKAGEYVSPSAPAAIIANNNGLEITTSVTQEDALALTIGDTVQLDETASGTVTAIAGAIDPTTGKVAVKISVSDTTTLQNGATVQVTFTKQAATKTYTMTIPLSAIKMTGSGPVTFMVEENKKLSAHPVTLGDISGDSVVITEGLTADSRIVTDARGLKEGQLVDVATK